MIHTPDSDRCAVSRLPFSSEHEGGFTLIELMITVAIIAILSSIAYPSYRESVAKGRRSDAQAVLVQGGQWMERFFAENYAYDKNTAGTAVTTLLTARYSQAPTTGTANYTVGLDSGFTAKAYTLRATRTGAMSGDKCGDFGLTHMGVKTIKNFGTQYADEAAAIAACWR